MPEKEPLESILIRRKKEGRLTHTGMNRNKDNEKSDKVDNIQGKGEPSKDLLDRLVYGKKANVLTITILTLKINIILNLN